jgi:hypothetical protein
MSHQFYVGEEGPSLQLWTNGRFGSIRPICRAVGDDRFLRNRAFQRVQGMSASRPQAGHRLFASEMIPSERNML